MKTISTNLSHGGVQGVYQEASSACNCDMTFAVFVPDQAKEAPLPVLWYLSGLTCTHANAMEKGEYRAAAAENGVIIVCPDTSPRGNDVADEPDNWQFGSGAGFYVEFKNILNGIEMIEKELTETLGKNAIKYIDCLGKPFDPNLHQAIGEKESEKEPGIILEEMQKGYLMHDRLLRPSMVYVSKKLQK